MCNSSSDSVNLVWRQKGFFLGGGREWQHPTHSFTPLTPLYSTHSLTRHLWALALQHDELQAVKDRTRSGTVDRKQAKKLEKLEKQALNEARQTVVTQATIRLNETQIKEINELRRQQEEVGAAALCTHTRARAHVHRFVCLRAWAELHFILFCWCVRVCACVCV